MSRLTPRVGNVLRQGVLALYDDSERDCINPVMLSRLTKEQLITIPGFGDEALEEVTERLADLGLKLSDTETIDLDDGPSVEEQRRVRERNRMAKVLLKIKKDLLSDAVDISVVQLESSTVMTVTRREE